MKTLDLRALCVSTVALGLAVAGCSSAVQPQESQESPRHSTSTAAEASPSAEKDGHAYVDPCELLSADEERQVVGEEPTYSDVPGFDPSDPRLGDCTLVQEESIKSLLHFGYSAVPNLSYAGRIEYMEDDEISKSEITPLEGVGDEAVHVEEDGYQEAWAHKGAYTVYVIANDGGADLETARSLLTSMLEKVEPGMLEHPISLPAACPGARSPHVVAATGKIVRAMGSQTETELRCAYASKKRTLELSSHDVSKAQIDVWEEEAGTLDDVTESEKVTRTYLPGVHTTLNRSDVGPGAFTIMKKPPRSMRADMDTVSRIDYSFAGVTTFDQGAFEALNESWVRRRAAAPRGK